VLVDRVQEAGFGALFVTVDSSGLTNLERLFKHRGSFPMKKSLKQGLHFAPQFATHPRWFLGFALDGMPTTYSSLPEQGGGAAVERARAAVSSGSMTEKGASHPCPTWSDIDWIRAQWRGPMVVKGVLTADDARRAIDHGADGIVLSNHGGRQLDGVPATLRMLSEVKSAVGDQLDILIDGGIRRGSDVVKALALGADAAMVGRPYLYGLAAAGQPGVARILDIFRDDILRVLSQIGCASVSDVNESAIDPSQLFASK
jgi:isopentenyl diphosphate isomerase/L-lactate dehydrogenase-like FMN-dependent dehydrogenase